MPTCYTFSAVESPAKPVGGRTVNAGGQPIQRFSKVIIRSGDWVHPATGEPVTVDAERIQHWADTFNEMSADGIRVPVPEDHTRDPGKNRGWVVSMSAKGDELHAIVEMIGDDAIKLAARVDCSISFTDQLLTASGKTFVDAIEHVALVADPAIPGLGSFQAVQLSKAGPKRLARSSPMEALKAIADALGISTDGLDEAGLTAAITAKIGEWKAAKETVDASKAEADTAKKELSVAQDQVKALQLSAGKPIEVDPDVIDSATRHFKGRLESLVKDGKVTPAVCTKLSAVIVGTATSPNAICLSRKAATAAGFAGPLGEAILDALNELPAKTTEGKGERTSLSRNVPGREDAPADVDPDLNARIAALAGKKAK